MNLTETVLIAVDLQPGFERTIAEGDKVVVQWSARGTHRGELMGVPPTGKAVQVLGTTLSRLESGRVVEEWTTWDEAGMLRQLGLLE